MRVQTSPNVDISRNSNGHISVLRDATVTLSVGHAGSPTCTVYVDVRCDLDLIQIKVKVTGLLNFRQLAMPCMLAAMTAAPLRGFLVSWLLQVRATGHSVGFYRATPC